MKLVIDIDENSREQLFDIANNGLDVPIGLKNIVIMAIVNGKPLGKSKYIDENLLFEKIAGHRENK